VRLADIFVTGRVLDERAGCHAVSTGQDSISNAADAGNHSIANSADADERC